MLDLIIKNGQCYINGELKNVDVAIQNGKIQQIGQITEETKEIVNAEKKIVLPGCIDTQTHFREPGSTDTEDLHSGSRAAIVGGITGVFEMPNTNPPTANRVEFKKKLDPVYKLIQKVKLSNTIKNKDIIGFIGAPWTLAVYMINKISPKKNEINSVLDDPNKIKNLTKKNKAHIGISLDGDADRIIVCDEKGNIIDGDKIIEMLALRWKRKKILKGGVVGTLMSNYGLEKFFKKNKTEQFLHYHLIGTGSTLWVCWQISTLAGIILGSFVPEELGLKFAIPLTFIAIIVQDLKKIDHVIVMLVCGIRSLLFFDAPFKSYIIISPIIALFVAPLLLRLKK